MDSGGNFDFLDSVREEYEEVRNDYLSSLKSRRYVSLEHARSHKLQIDWASYQSVKPAVALNVPHYVKEYDLSVIRQFIDWKPFFDTWQLRGKYPNRGFPRIFNDATVGSEAKKLFDDAQSMLDEICQQRLLRANGVYAFYRACQVDEDDIALLDEQGNVSLPSICLIRHSCLRISPANRIILSVSIDFSA